MKGNEAIAEAAIRGGCRFFFGYPITPQNEIPEYMSRRLPEVGGVYLQAESEVAAINMVYGAAAAGARVMTSSSSPGISLKQEGLSYIAACELPCVVVNMMRGGPGLGGIQPSQSDYFQATKGGGHGDYHLIVFGPASVQEAADITCEAFSIADYYRNPVMILGDGALGQMMEPVEFRPVEEPELPPKTWATTGARGRRPNIITSLELEPALLEELNRRLAAKYEKIKRELVRFDTYKLEDAHWAIVAYGMMARVARAAVDKARARGIRAGLFRPISLFPFPYDSLARVAEQVRAFLTVEMSMGQMVEDVKLAVLGKRPVHFYGRTGGVVPTAQEILQALERIIQNEAPQNANGAWQKEGDAGAEGFWATGGFN
ncbi:MAG TPA: 3-methyl-2-oxobutanoate dehydrogenase subunit VorB [Firmicutes bacterium]|nr:3-methyl-2-oxobutanoate dehydrogenase subunit VorB [Bacillota bacterium]